MKELEKKEMMQIDGGAWTSEHAISGGLSGGLLGAGGAAAYIGMATNPVGWVALGIIGAGAGAGALYQMAFK